MARKQVTKAAKPAKAPKAPKAAKTSSRFLDPAKIDAAIAEVATLAKQQGVRVALIGGCALQLHGSDRFTADVDFVATEHLTALPVNRTLTFGGAATVTSTGVPVDIVVRDDQYEDLYAAAVDAAERIPNIPVLVVTLPYLGAMKLAAGRGKDMQDLAFILLDTNVDYVKLRAVVTKHLGPYAADELDAYKRTAAWEREGRR